MQYTEKTIRRKADAIGYTIKKGYVRTKAKPYAIHKAVTGYTICDNDTSHMVYGDSELYYNLLTLEGVEDFLKEAYTAEGLIF